MRRYVFGLLAWMAIATMYASMWGLAPQTWAAWAWVAVVILAFIGLLKQRAQNRALYRQLVQAQGMADALLYSLRAAEDRENLIISGEVLHREDKR